MRRNAGRWTRRLGLAAMVGAVGWASIGCAQERDPINRVQPNALSKHFFAGADLSSPKDDPEFYMQNTVVDVPFGAGQDGLFTATYAQPLNRVKWEISENALIARQTYERIKDSDHQGNKATNKGQVVAMFAISSHFDIRREYNPTTGEEQNIIGENTSDRPWYQREYMRVDWSKNMVTDGYEVDTLSQVGLYGGVKWDPMSYYVEDPKDPNAPAFDEKEHYFDVTTKAFASPQILDTPWGAFPACFFFGQHPVTNCNPTEVTLRLSFRAVPDNDFEPSDYDGNKMEAFGWFYEDRYGYERNYGLLDEKWHKIAAKYNIWEKSHIPGSQCGVDYYRADDGSVAKYKTDGNGNFLTDPNNGTPVLATADDKNAKPFPSSPVGSDANRDINGNKTADECEFTDKSGNALHAGSRCDEMSKKCTLPLYERKIKTIPWYYGPDSPADLFPSTSKSLDQWNIAVKRAAQIGKKVSATRVGLDGSEYETAESALVDDNGKTVQHVFVLCHNPTIDSDDASCFGPDHKQVYARVGDIRYNMVNLVNTPQTPSPWGIMVDAEDPLTGEKVSTSVNEWAHVLDIASQGTEDLLRWVNGEISDDQIMSGAYLRDWVKSSNMGISQYQPKTLSKAEIQSRMNSLTVPHVMDNAVGTALKGTTPGQMTREKWDDMTNKLSKQAQAQLGPSIDRKFEGMRQSLIGTKWESQMTTPEDLQAAGFDPQTPTAGDDFVMSKASPLRGQNPEMRRWLKKLKNQTGAQRAHCIIEQPEPDALVGLARHAQRLYPLPDAKDPNYPAKKAERDQQLHQWIREQFHVAVILHEMGHSMGLRHNFTGSFDAVNYHPQYWQLRTRNGKEPACKASELDPHTNGEDCAGPRWMDPVTDTETNGLIWKWGSSTVMDYPGDVTQDMNDLGAYDKAAVRFMYGETVDIDVKSKKGDTAQGDFNLDRLDGFGGISGPLDFTFAGDYHYSQAQERFKVLGTCTAQTDPKDPLSAKCTGPDLDYVSFYDMKDNGTGDRRQHFAIDPKGRTRHAYMFGSDEYADFGNLPVFRFDAGADAYEQFQFVSTTYENRYIFDNFRRDRTTFNTGTVVGRAQDRYFDKFDTSTKALALYMQLWSGFIDETFFNDGTTGRDFMFKKPGGLLPHVLASSDSFATWIRMMTRPEPGPYYAGANNVASADPPQIGKAIPLFTVAAGSGEGRYLHNDYDYSKGYGWGEYQKQVGSFYEKRMATYYLTVAYNHFIQNSKQDYIDSRLLNINYATIYPEQMRRFFSQVMQNDTTTLGPYVEPSTGNQTTGTPIGRVRYLPWEKFDATQTATTSLAYPKTAQIVSPLVGWEEQYPALIDGYIFGGTTLTMDWVDQMRIFTPGGPETVALPLDQQIRYADAATGLVYAARNYGKELVNGQPVARTSGARMLEFASQLANKTFVVLSTDPVTGEATYKRDAATREPICAIEAKACEANKAQLRLYSANIDSVRQLGDHFGTGPLDRF
ncbi:MAG: hypothetical protein JWM74_5038 [Myxococcaceae bacterium]|nr:hypothetical protein [Myxococcaceae bacterium]